MGIIHKGRYEGPKLITLVPRTLIDNRIVHIESFVKPGKLHYGKSLEEKGILRKKKTQTVYLSKKEQYRRKLKISPQMPIHLKR
jgi:hypothetical protein